MSLTETGVSRCVESKEKNGKFDEISKKVIWEGVRVWEGVRTISMQKCISLNWNLRPSKESCWAKSTIGPHKIEGGEDFHLKKGINR